MVLLVEPFYEYLREGHDVFRALSQSRQMDVHRVDSVEEVLPESAFLHLLTQIHVRGADKADVHVPWFGVSDTGDCPVLKDPQKLCLKMQGNIPDLVQEQGSALGHLDLTDLVSVSVRKGPLDVAEELALEKRLRNRTCVHADHQAVTTLGMIVYLSGQKVFAGSVLSCDEHRRICRADLLDCLLDLGHSL